MRRLHRYYYELGSGHRFRATSWKSVSDQCDRLRNKYQLKCENAGHGGMPVECGDAPDIECSWLAWDNRRYHNGEKINVGFNGHANLTLNGPELHVDYVDLNCTTLLTENWHVDRESGELHVPS